MAFKFNAILDFNSNKAKAGMDQARKGFDTLKKSITSASEALGKINQGMRGAAFATAPAAAAVGFMTKTAADFEEQMSIVQSVILGTQEEMDMLNKVTKRLGATTAFSAKEAGQGAEFLARAGFSAQQIVGALPGVLDAAAAAGVDLGTAADIVAGQLGAFGLKAEQAGEVADALSLTTALTNTNFEQLGESMKFAAPIASAAGLTLQQTASAMGVLANAGVKGSLAGTALKNALLQVSKPSKAALELFGGRSGLNQAMLETVNVNGKLVTRLRPLEVVMANVSKVVQNAKNPLEATAQAAEIFGLRGTTAFASFEKKLGETTTVNDKNIEQLRKGIAATGENIQVNIGDAIPSLVALRLQIAGASGTAKEMARIRLNNLNGQFILFKSALEGLSIEIGGMVTGPLKDFVTVATDGLSLMAIAFQVVNQGSAATAEQLDALKDNQFKDLLQSAIEFAGGFKEGFSEVLDAGKETFNTIREFLTPILGEGALTAKEFGKIAAKVLFIGAVAAPVFASIAAGFFVLGPIIQGVVGTVQLLAAGFGVIKGIALIASGAFRILLIPLTSTLGIIALVIAGIVGVIRKWDEVKQAFADKGFLAALWEGFKAFFGGIVDLILLPFNLLKRGVSGLLGLGGDQAQRAAAQTVQIPRVPNAGDIANQMPVPQTPIRSNAAELAAQRVNQSALVQPASAEETASAVAGALQGQQPAAASSGTQNVNVRVQVEGKIKGKDLNLVQTREQINQTEMNGRQLPPAAKQRMLRNGAQATGF